MATLTIPEFITADSAAIQADMVAFYEGLTNRTIQPADAEMFIFNVLAYRETILRNNINDASLQNLVAFANFPSLDYLAQNSGITNRIPPQKATVNIEFQLNPSHPNMVIQAGTRVSHPDGNPVFSVIDDTFVLAGVNAVDILCQATTEGAQANGYLPGTITQLIDSFTNYLSCMNTESTDGGSAEETDEQLRERTFLAPAAYSCAGPLDAYKFFALSSHPSIIDVSVQGPELGLAYPPAGTIAVYPLTTTVPTPPAIIAAVQAAFTGNKKLPLTDTVAVIAPTAINYTIDVSLTLYNGADDLATIDIVTNALNTYTQTKGSKMGLDIVRSQINALCVVDGAVYNPVLNSPVSDISVPSSSFGNCTSINVTIAGYTNG